MCSISEARKLGKGLMCEIWEFGKKVVLNLSNIRDFCDKEIMLRRFSLKQERQGLLEIWKPLPNNDKS